MRLQKEVSTHNQTGSTIEIFHNGAAIPLLKPIAQDQYGKLAMEHIKHCKNLCVKNGENYHTTSVVLQSIATDQPILFTSHSVTIIWPTTKRHTNLTDGETFNKDDSLVISLQDSKVITTLVYY